MKSESLFDRKYIMSSSFQGIALYRHRLLTLGVLVLSTLVSLALLLVRWVVTGHTAYHWLVWDMFLAWVPMWISMVVYILHLRGSRNKPLLLWLGFAWLLFLPNAPYLLTEFVHLGRRHNGPWWCDLMLTIGFAWNGLLLGLLSLYVMQKVVQARAGARRAATMSAVSLALCSFGISLGRFNRFNSWDVVRHPFALAAGILDELLHPFHYRTLFGSSFLLFVFLTLAYAALWALVTLNYDERMDGNMQQLVRR
jgi:uncharacterized membrane protein